MKLRTLFDTHSCDKGHKHGYETVYEPALEALREKGSDAHILEVGVFRGESLNAFVEFLPEANFYGLDIFVRTTPAQLPILKHSNVDWLKQDTTAPSAGQKVAAKWPDVKFDLIIDDGLHTPKANMQTFNNLMPLLADDGVFYIEDVFPLDRMTEDEINSVAWLRTQPEKYNHMDMMNFNNAVDKFKVKRHDLRKASGQPDSYIVEVRK